MDAVVSALADQQAELAEILLGLKDSQWSSPTRCDGWDVADVVLHLAQSDGMAVASATGSLDGGTVERRNGGGGPGSVDAMVASLVEKERGISHGALMARWTSTSGGLIDVLSAMDLSTRVTWVAGELSARTLTTTRLAETWIHAGDIADAVGTVVAPTDRLQHIARLAWRTLPYAFAQTGSEMKGPVAFRLVAPDGSRWDLLPGETALTTVSGPAIDLCNVAARRLDPSDSSLSADGPDGERVLALVRTYA